MVTQGTLKLASPHRCISLVPSGLFFSLSFARGLLCLTPAKRRNILETIPRFFQERSFERGVTSKHTSRWRGKDGRQNEYPTPAFLSRTDTL